MNLTKYTVIVVVALIFIEAITSLLSAADDGANILALLLIPFFVFAVKKLNNVEYKNLKFKSKKKYDEN
jgi:sulfate adenylyltransferase subunit 1 (EFTu-like GTPase family)